MKKKSQPAPVAQPEPQAAPANSRQRKMAVTAENIARWQAMPVVLVNFQPWHEAVIVAAVTESMLMYPEVEYV